jgi:RNA polymerase sigma factor (sigma-70 family)
MDDAELLKLFSSTRDQQAFAALVDRHGPMVLGICRRILCNGADADDAFQATFLLLAMKAGRVRQPHLLAHWLFGVATRTAVGARRANSRRVFQEMRLMRILRPRSTRDTGDVDTRLSLDEEINRLPEKYRRVIVACYLQGMTKREAAEQLKWPEGTVATRLSHAIKLLRKRLVNLTSLASADSLATALAPVAVPAALAGSTIKLGMLSAAGKLAGAAAISAKAVCAAKAVSNAMTFANIKLALALLVVSSLAISGAVLTSQPRAQSQPVTRSSHVLELPPQVEQALRRNAEQLDPIDVSWNQRNRPDIPLEQALSLLKTGPFIFAASTREIVFQRAKVYARVLTPDNSGKNEVSFDGRILYLGNSGSHQRRRCQSG